MTAKIVVVNPGADVYGSDLQMLQSLMAFREVGWRTLVVLPQEGPLIRMLSDAGFSHTVLAFPTLRRSALTLGGMGRLLTQVGGRQWPLVRFLRKAAPDVVYVNTITIPWWIGAARMAGLPVVCHDHEAEEASHWLVKAGLNAPLSVADAVIVNSEFSRRVAVQSWPPLSATLSVIHNGVPDRPNPVVPAVWSERPFRLATVSRLSPRKGVHEALDAVELLRGEGRDVVLEIAGTTFEGYEWYEEDLRRRATSADLRGAVTFSGYVSPVWPVIDRSHVVLFPSSQESFGNAVIEAQLSQRPVIAAGATGHLETIDNGRTGLHVVPGDPAEMAKVVGQLMDDPDQARKLATAGREHARQAFGVDRYREQIREAVRVASLKRRSPGRRS